MGLVVPWEPLAFYTWFVSVVNRLPTTGEKGQPNYPNHPHPPHYHHHPNLKLGWRKIKGVFYISASNTRRILRRFSVYINPTLDHMLIMNTHLQSDLTQPAEKYLKIIKRKIFFFLELSASENISHLKCRWWDIIGPFAGETDAFSRFGLRPSTEALKNPD